MSKTRSFALALFLLLAMLVAVAWGLARFERGSWTSAAATETTYVSGTNVCYFTPGHEFAAPTAVEIAEARASWGRWHANTHVCWIGGDIFGLPSADDIAQARRAAAHAYDNVCIYDPSQGFRLLPGDRDLHEARRAAQAAHGAGHAVGGIAPLPATDTGLVGAGIAAAVGAGLLALRYLRRTAGAASDALETSGAATPAGRSWLTKRRVATVGAGWLMTIGVLAAAYPVISTLIPHAQELPGEDAKTPVQPAAGTSTPYDPADDAAPAPQPEVSNALGQANDFTLPPPAPADSNGGVGPADGGSSQASLSAFVPGFAGGASNGGSASAGSAAAENAAIPDAPAATQTLGRVGSSLASLAAYLPATTAVTTVTTGGTSTGASTGGTSGTPGGSATGAATSSSTAATATPAVAGDGTPAGTPATAPVTTVADSTQPAVSAMPILDPTNPLPTGSDAVVPSTGGNGNGTVPANPIGLDNGGGSTDVPEPAMLGLFGIGALAVMVRRRAK